MKSATNLIIAILASSIAVDLAVGREISPEVFTIGSGDSAHTRAGAIANIRDDGDSHEINLEVLGTEYEIIGDGVHDDEPSSDANRIVLRSGGLVRPAINAGELPDPPVGACCDGPSCSIVTEADCIGSNGEYNGNETLCSVDACGTGPSENWPMLHHDAQRTGRTNALVPDLPTRVWSVRKGPVLGPAEPFDGPIVGPGNTVMVAEDNSSNLVFDGNHELLWRATNHVVRDPGIARSDGNFFVNSNDKLRKVDGASGADLCSISANLSVNSVMDPEGNVYIYNSTATRLQKIAPDCSLVWSTTMSEPVRSPIALGTNGSVYVGTDFELFNFDAATGTQQWSIPTPATTRGAVIGANDAVYFTVEPNQVWAYDADGNELWTHAFTNAELIVAEERTSLPAIGADGALYVPATHKKPDRRALVAIDSSGAELWTHVETDPIASNVAPIIDGSGAIIFAGKEYLVALEPDGSERWRLPVGGTIKAAPAIGDDGSIYLVTRDGDLMILNDSCPENVLLEPRFAYDRVMAIGEDVNGLTIGSIKEFELGNDGSVTVLAGVSGSSDDVAFVQDAIFSSFTDITSGDSLGGQVLTGVSLPRRDSAGNVVLPAEVGSSNAVFVNGTLVVSELAAAPIQIDDFWLPSYVDVNNNNEFALFARRIGDPHYGLHKVDWLSQTLTPLIIDPEWQDIVPARVNGFGDDGRIVFGWADGLTFEIRDQFGTLFDPNDMIDGIRLGAVRNPRRTDDDSIVFRATGSDGTGAVSVSSNGIGTFLYKFTDSIQDLPALNLDVLEVNPATGEIGSINGLLAGLDGIFMAGEPVAVEEKSLIDDQLVLSVGTSKLSTNRLGQIAFIANVENLGTALYVATPTPRLDSNRDGFVHLDDYEALTDCFSGPAEYREPACSIFDVDDDCHIEMEDIQALQLAYATDDCNSNGIPDLFETDCNGNMKPDTCDVMTGFSPDLNTNAIPDECESDCNDNDVPDDWDILVGTSLDCLGNGIPDECEPVADCNTNGIADQCEVAAATSSDCNLNIVPDECELDGNDCNANLVPDECDEANLITAQPSSLSVCSDDPVVFSVTAAGADSFQWKLDNIDLLDGGGISGATTDTLSISGAEELDQGVYTCEVTNDECIVVTSAGATLEILDAGVSITSQPVSSISACPGQTKIISVVAVGEGLTYEWRKDGVTLADGGNLSGVDTPTLTISSLDLADEANAPGYTCLVSDGVCFSEESTASVLKLVSPTFSMEPQDVIVDSGQPAVFSSAVDPLAGFFILLQWHKDGSPVTDGGNISGAFTDTLTINPAGAADVGGYSLRALVLGPNCIEFSVTAQLTVNE